MRGTKPQLPTRDALGTRPSSMTGKTQRCCAREDTLAGELELKSRMGSGIPATKPLIQILYVSYPDIPLYPNPSFFLFFLETKSSTADRWEATSCPEHPHVTRETRAKNPQQEITIVKMRNFQTTLL